MEPTWKSSAAGIINVVGGIVGLLGTLTLAGIVLFSTGMGGFVVVESGEALGGMPFLAMMLFFGGLAFMGFALSAVAVYGGIHCLMRRSWAWGVAGSIATFLILFPIGVLPVIFVLMAEFEFEGRGPKAPESWLPPHAAAEPV